jgi:hypothetical protein
MDTFRVCFCLLALFLYSAVFATWTNWRVSCCLGNMLRFPYCPSTSPDGRWRTKNARSFVLGTTTMHHQMQRARSLERLVHFIRFQNVETVFQYLKTKRNLFEKDSLSLSLLVRKYGSKNTRKFGTTARSAGCRCCLLDITAVRAAGGSVSFIRRSVRF